MRTGAKVTKLKTLSHYSQTDFGWTNWNGFNGGHYISALNIFTRYSFYLVMTSSIQRLRPRCAPPQQTFWPLKHTGVINTVVKVNVTIRNNFLLTPFIYFSGYDRWPAPYFGKLGSDAAVTLWAATNKQSSSSRNRWRQGSFEWQDQL